MLSNWTLCLICTRCFLILVLDMSNPSWLSDCVNHSYDCRPNRNPFSPFTITMVFLWNPLINKPFSHLLPAYPAMHPVHLKSFTRSVQFPPFWQGLLAQSSMSRGNQSRSKLPLIMYIYYIHQGEGVGLIRGRRIFRAYFNGSFRIQ